MGGDRDNRGWDGWMASPTQWTCIWASSRSWWWTGRPGMLQSTGSQRAGHNWMTELRVVKVCLVNFTDLHVETLLSLKMRKKEIQFFTSRLYHASRLISSIFFHRLQTASLKHLLKGRPHRQEYGHGLLRFWFLLRRLFRLFFLLLCSVSVPRIAA